MAAVSGKFPLMPMYRPEVVRLSKLLDPDFSTMHGKPHITIFTTTTLAYELDCRESYGPTSAIAMPIRTERQAPDRESAAVSLH